MSKKHSDVLSKENDEGCDGQIVRRYWRAAPIILRRPGCGSPAERITGVAVTELRGEVRFEGPDIRTYSSRLLTIFAITPANDRQNAKRDAFHLVRCVKPVER